MIHTGKSKEQLLRICRILLLIICIAGLLYGLILEAYRVPSAIEPGYRMIISPGFVEIASYEGVMVKDGNFYDIYSVPGICIREENFDDIKITHVTAGNFAEAKECRI